MSIKYSVSLYPHFKDRSHFGNEVLVAFLTDEEKQAYVAAETKAVVKEFQKYSAAIQVSERDEAQAELMKKRVDFAKKMNYVPNRTGGSIWWKKQGSEPKEIA